ncbi:MAG: hypothetical protein K2M95_03000 [Clostridiales bacterium]|nr:hypothetical protein [Clostridiales bacterium]
MKKITTVFTAFILVLASALTLTGCGLFGSGKDNGNITTFEKTLNAKPVSASNSSSQLNVLDAVTDGTYNYFLVDIGCIKDMYISTLAMVDYTGLPISFSKTTNMSSTYMSSVTKSVSESITVSDSQSAKVGISVAWEKEFAKPGTFSVKGNLEWNGTWTNTNTSSKSTSNTVESAKKFEESQTVSYSFGENTSPIGRYRYATYGIGDVYFTVKTSLDNSKLVDIDTIVCARESDYFLRSEFSSTGEFNNAPIGDINIQEDFYRYLPIPTKSGELEKPCELVVYDGTIRTGKKKIRGSGRFTVDSFTLNKSIDELKDAGYTKLHFEINYQLKEVNNCLQYISLRTVTNTSIREETMSHGGSSKNKNWETHCLSCSYLLNGLDSHTFNFKCQAENKMWKDFYIGTVTVKVTAT